MKNNIINNLMAGINYRIPYLDIEERKIRQPEAFDGPIPNDH
jgi:hypothetical protein